MRELSKHDKIYVIEKVPDPAQSFVLFSCTMYDDVTKTFLLVSSSVSRGKQLSCFVHGQGGKKESELYNKAWH